jgi:hypothetical protein
MDLYGGPATSGLEDVFKDLPQSLKSASLSKPIKRNGRLATRRRRNAK